MKNEKNIFWDGYCPECKQKGERVGMRLNSFDFFECEKSGLQIVLTTPQIFATIINFRGKGEWRIKHEYAHNNNRDELLCRQLNATVPLGSAQLDVDFTRFTNDEELEQYLVSIAK